MAEEQKPLLKFRFPKVREIEAYVVEMPDGTIELRTKEQLKKKEEGHEREAGKE